MIPAHLVYDVKQDGRCKARLVAGGHITGHNTNTYYSSIVLLRAMRMMIFLVELNGKEFQDYGHECHLMLPVKALYGLKTSGA
eukprot:1319409-Ditylum_brightwellii.AAC.1